MNKETGIIMSGNHPKLILDGVKTMTRRTYGLEEINKEPNRYRLSAAQDYLQRFYTFFSGQDEPLKFAKCPYGQVGDRLWVRETFYPIDLVSKPDIVYKASNPESDTIRWRPSIHMPRWASRILVGITELRAERLQEITSEDCREEGLRYPPQGDTTHYIRAYIDGFRTLWDSLNAKRGYEWDTNCWVWVIGFKVIK